MKKVFISLALLFVLAIALIIFWVVHSFNAESYRKQIIDVLSQATGRSVEIKGPVSLTWTPFPIFVISDLTIANQEGSSTPIMFQVDQIRTEVEWGSLFKRPLLIKKIELKHPTLLLERVKGNQTNFNFPQLFRAGVRQEDGTFLESKSDLSLIVNDIRVEDGVFTYENKLTNEKFTVSQIECDGKMDSLEGPFVASGKLEVLGKTQEFKLDIGKIEPSQPLVFSLQLDEPESATKIRFIDNYFVYNVDNPEDWLVVSGSIESEKPDLFFQKIFPNLPKKELKANFDLNVMARKILLNGLTVRQMDQKKGTTEDSDTVIYFGPEKLDAKERKEIVDIKNMDFSEWNGLVQAILKNKTLTKQNRSFRLQFENIKLKSEVLPKGQGEIKLDGGVLTFSDVQLDLPYSSSARLSGQMMLKDESVTLDVQLQSSDFKSLYGWLTGKKLENVPEGNFKELQLNGILNYKPDAWKADVKTGTFDKVRFTGQLEMQSKANKLFKIKGKVDDLDLNTYFQEVDFVSDLKKPFWKGINASIDVSGTNLVFQDRQLDTYVLKAELKNDVLSFQNFSFEQKDKTTFKVSGDLENIGTDTLSAKQLLVDFVAQEKTSFYSWVQSNLSLLKGAKELQGNFSYTGTQAQGTFQLDMQADKLHILSDGKLISPMNEMKFEETNFSFSYPENQEFISLFPEVKEWLPRLKGNLNVSLQGAGTLQKMRLDSILASVGKQSFSGNGILNVQEKNFNLSLSTPSLELGLFLPKVNEIFSNDKRSFKITSLPEWNGQIKLQADKLLYNDDEFDSFKTQLSFGKQNVQISSCDFVSQDKKGTTHIEGTLEFKPEVSFSGMVNMTDMSMTKKNLDFKDLSLKDGLLTFKTTLSMKGNSWGDLTNNLQGEGEFSWQNGTLKGIDLNELTIFVQKALDQKLSSEVISKRIKHILSNGNTPFSLSNTPFKLEKGRLKVSETTLKTKWGDIVAKNLSWFIPKNEMDVKISIFLNILKEFPFLELQMRQNKVALQTDAFEKALQQEIKARMTEEQKQEYEKKRQREEQEQEHFQTTAQEILVQSEKQIQDMKNKVTLNPSDDGNNLLNEAEKNASEIRELAVLSVLTEEQYQRLQEKANLLNAQAKEMEELLVRQGVVVQKDDVRSLLAIVQDRLSDMTRIYKRNSASSILAGLLQGSQIESQKIQEMWANLQRAQDVNEAENLVKEIRSSFQKIEKAWNYANQLEEGIIPSSPVTGSISVIED